MKVFLVYSKEDRFTAELIKVMMEGWGHEIIETNPKWYRAWGDAVIQKKPETVKAVSIRLVTDSFQKVDQSDAIVAVCMTADTGIIMALRDAGKTKKPVIIITPDINDPWLLTHCDVILAPYIGNMKYLREKLGVSSESVLPIV